MRLDVRLTDHVEADLVGELEERRVVRIVRGPDRVEPELLHLDKVRPHRLPGHDPARVLVEVMAVHAAEEDPPAVDEEVESPDLNPVEADLDLRRLDDLAGWRTKGHPQRTQRRPFGRPWLDRRHLDIPADEAVDGWSEAVEDPGPGLGLGRCELSSDGTRGHE